MQPNVREQMKIIIPETILQVIPRVSSVSIGIGEHYISQEPDLNNKHMNIQLSFEQNQPNHTNFDKEDDDDLDYPYEQLLQLVQETKILLRVSISIVIDHNKINSYYVIVSF